MEMMLTQATNTIAALPVVQETREAEKTLKRKATDGADMENKPKKFKKLQVEVTKKQKKVKKSKKAKKSQKPKEAPEPVDEQMEVPEEPMSDLEKEVQKWCHVLSTTDEPSIALLELLGLQAPLELYEKYEIQAWALEHWYFPDEELQAEINELWYFIERLKPKKKCCRNLAKELQMMMV